MLRKKNVAFNFGINWNNFSTKFLDGAKLNIALNSLEQLIGMDNIKCKSFLDIGCGSGIFAIAASKSGAQKVVGIDISKESIETSLFNKQRFLPDGNVEFLHKSVFDDDFNELGCYDIVYSWGVLHHTGDMWKAIGVSTMMVGCNGLFVLAIYNKHWSSPLWKIVKRIYNLSPVIIRQVMVCVFYCVIALAKFFVTTKNPFKDKKRGMSFYYDVVDWIGGYPYQYATISQIQSFIEAKGFKLINFRSPVMPTGCNEFVFQKMR